MIDKYHFPFYEAMKSVCRRVGPEMIQLKIMADFVHKIRAAQCNCKYTIIYDGIHDNNICTLVCSCMYDALELGEYKINVQAREHWHIPKTSWSIDSVFMCTRNIFSYWSITPIEKDRTMFRRPYHEPAYINYASIRIEIKYPSWQKKNNNNYYKKPNIWVTVLAILKPILCFRCDIICKIYCLPKP